MAEEIFLDRAPSWNNSVTLQSQLITLMVALSVFVISFGFRVIAFALAIQAVFL